MIDDICLELDRLQGHYESARGNNERALYADKYRSRLDDLKVEVVKSRSRYLALASYAMWYVTHVDGGL
jgi:hypothetical protein